MSSKNPPLENDQNEEESLIEFPCEFPLTLTINAKDKPQLDAIYKDFTDHELVLWAL